MPQSFLSRVFRRGPSDVELENESGRVDPRLPKSWATEKVQLREAGRSLRRSVAMRDALLQQMKGGK